MGAVLDAKVGAALALLVVQISDDSNNTEAEKEVSLRRVAKTGRF